MRDGETTSFWTEGPARLREALESRRPEVDDLVERLQNATSSRERDEIEARLREMLEVYRPSEAEIEQSLFFFR